MGMSAAMAAALPVGVSFKPHLSAAKRSASTNSSLLLAPRIHLCSHEFLGKRFRVFHISQHLRKRSRCGTPAIWLCRHFALDWVGGRPSHRSRKGSGSCITSALRQDQGEDEKDVNKGKSVMSVEKVARVSGILATLIVATAALFARSSVEQLSGAKKKKGKAGRKVRTMPLEERAEWTKDLPPVQDRIPYSDVIALKKEEKLKHIIKHPNAALQTRPYQVFVVLDDQRVLRTVLPAADRDSSFWSFWNELKLQEAVIDAYTPAPPPVELQGWATKGPSLTFLWRIEPFIKQIGRLKDRKKESPSKPQTVSQSRLRLLEQAKLERERERVAKEMQKKREQAQKARAEREAKARAFQVQEMKKKQEMERETRLAQKEARKSKVAQEIQSKADWDNFYYTISRNEGFRFCLGVFFFWLFYQTIVVGVKKRKQDYEDRIKIEKAEGEERKKLREWERAMETAEAISVTQELNMDDMSEIEKQRIEEAQKNPQVQLGLRFMKSGAHVRRAKGRRPPQYLDLDADVKFADVAGLGDIRKELEEIVDFFTYGEKYRRRGSKIPAGILLCGEPGVGKTLLAKAVAGEAGVNFFSISASQFVEIYVGVGASRVRALYSEAKENAPAVVFIDELDAVGRQRGLIGGSGGQERDATLNQLLTCLDGFEGRGDVITIAATNRPDILDTALVRPGRFDRKIFIPKPGVKGRSDILKVHAKNKPMAEEVDYRAVAEMTEGMVGAQLANLVDVAALAVLRDGRSEITTDDLLEAAQLEEGGHPDPFVRSDKLMHTLALQEASMAAVAVNFPDFKEIQLITIVPRMGEEKGLVRFKTDITKFQCQTIRFIHLGILLLEQETI
ncbi:hypothetical protein O6H91_01G130600 [Diphasiastrum complanatum]|uniref:Uncharacterized protein n=1 Tax=Diphasiastrum complanatum TaxID=34168 RepID=A0ACC2EW25_DIPCM|nr:hypothetical protein O6H91_01G130600 [Diphasiastrum complanatum]